MLQLSVTALFYLEDSRKIHLRGVRARRSKDARRRAPQCVGEKERELALAPLFICLSLPGPVLCKLGQPGVLFVLPEVLTPVLGPSFVLFSWAFPFLVFQPPPFWTPFPYSTYLTKPCGKQMCCYPGFIVPLIDHRQSRFSRILKGCRIFGMINEHCFQL